MRTFIQWIMEGRSFEYGGSKYSSGFGRYTKDGVSISKEDYQKASDAYKKEQPIIKAVKTKKKTTKKRVAKKEETPAKTTKKKIAKKPKTEFDRIHAGSKTYQMLQDNPFTPSKTLKECEKKIESYGMVKCHLSGITDKEVFNGIAESVHKVFSRYPFIADSRDLQYIATQAGMNKTVEKDVEEYMNSPELKASIQKDFEYIQETRKFAKIGTPAYKSIYAIPMTMAESKKFRAKHNITYETIIDENVSNIIKEAYFDYAKKKKKKQYKEDVMPNMGSTKKAYAFYLNTDYEQSSWKKFAGVYMSPTNMKRSTETYEIGVASNFHPAGTHHDSIITHEIGHTIDFVLNLRNDDEIYKLYKSGDPAETVSRYARTNIKEFIAESFAEYMHSPEPREMAKKVGAIIDKRYQEYAEKRSRDIELGIGV